MRQFFIIIMLLLYPISAYSNVLDPHEIIESSARFYPEIKQIYASIEASKTRIRQAEGAFDPVFTQDLKTRPDGYYNGTFSETRLSQPIREYNANVYTGYRFSDGTFPIYENIRETEDLGEYYIGVKFSLLRDRVINKKLAKISINELKVIEKETQLLLDKLTIQRNALQKYWSWVSAGHQLRVTQDLLRLAQTRQKNLKKQVEHGQIAAVFLQENQQYLLKRQADVNIAEAHFENAAQALSLYYRDQKGQPIMPTHKEVPKMMQFLNMPASRDDYIDMIHNHPIFKILDTQKSIFNQQKMLAENDLLPYLDFDIKASQDYGDDASRTLDEGELLFNLQLKVPLYRTVAKSDREFTLAKLKEILYKEQFQLEKLRIAINQMMINMRNQKKFLDVTKQEYVLAKKMSQIEAERFRAGVSDFFTLNRREEDMMEVRLKRIKAQENLLKIQEDIRVFTAQLDPVFMQ